MERIKQEAEHIYIWQPGNGTRYRLCMRRMKLESGLEPKRWMVTWLRYGDVAGPSLIINVPGAVYASYVANKMDIDVADAVAICIFLRDSFDFTVDIPSSFEQRTGRWHGLAHGNQPTDEE
ncbi:unnamed protein product [marine sediment metagenome]|uniref:Uncharacterized protein n=1 Tax=marine sediment metagenome TaxID=412755 RepID=X0RPK7_9ZZZZ